MIASRLLIPVWVIGVGLICPATLSADSTFPWRTEVNKTRCEGQGSPVIQIVEHVINSIDSGEGGNYWAYDFYVRHIQAWEIDVGLYCVVAAYHGRFDGQAGEISPGATGYLTGDEDGAFEGGFRAIITGELVNGPGWPLHGSVGTTDYACDISGVCPGRVDWVLQYFEADAVFEYEWWGWIYDGAANGVWINSSDGNQGDVLNNQAERL